ncbi:MAG: rhodanese-like domain-containing protein [Rhodocyclaceae bacterium]|nr:rhodanese-like domain-containing protein [Plasticicumulans sp.]HNJ76577.1 rhodanese-like domain-containing protein [Azospira sp.]HNN09363.1 rhodanese-like domain-containing protein [Azospira sp.]HNN47027.1 rhodanese-like domain-containing protein [Azospira sp.]
MDFIQQNLMLVILTVTSGAMLLFNLVQGGSGARVTTSEATNLINREDAQVLDVREAADFATGHLAGARNIPVAKFGERAADLEKLKAAPLIVCCETGIRSMKAVSTLKKQGFERVFSLDGGIAAWNKAGLPLTTKKDGRK